LQRKVPDSYGPGRFSPGAVLFYRRHPALFSNVISWAKFQESRLPISITEELRDCGVGGRQCFLIGQEDNAEMLGAGLLPEA
jgi:hypothetical protein